MKSARRSDYQVSIVIPCRNEITTIGGLLDSLLTTLEDDAEIVVADGRSNDGSRELVAELARQEPRVRLVDNPDRTTPAGLNAAIRAAQGKFIVRMDAHSRYAEDYVGACLEALEASGADNVGGPQLADLESRVGYVAKAIAAGWHSPLAAGGARIHDPDFEGPTDSVAYGCWRRELFDSVGLFDEALLRNQDGEHNHRILLNGGVVWQTYKARSLYRTRSSLTALYRQHAQYGYWKALEIERIGAVRALRQVAPAAFLLYVMGTGVLSLAWQPAQVAFGLGIFSYILFQCAAAIELCARRGFWTWLPLLPIVFASMQLGYGWGLLRGALDFWVLNRSPRPRFREQTH